MLRQASRVAFVAGMTIGLALAMASPARAELPPGYDPVPGTIPLNPAHVGAVGSEFTQQCTGLPRPVAPGEVAWHFILPQTATRGSPTPENVFDTLTVTFRSAGTVVLDQVVEFGPPSLAHAYVYTSTDDVLTGESATIGRQVADTFGNDAQFNLSHTCASTEAPPTTTTTSEPTTTATEPTTSTSTSTTATTAPTDPNTTTTISPGGGVITSTTFNAGGGGTLPATGMTGLTVLVAIGATAIGAVGVVIARRRVGTR